MNPIILNPGTRFGRLVVVGRADGQTNGIRKWACRCDCGKENHEVSASLLTRGKTKSCGCLARETAAEFCRRTKTTHGKRNTPEFRAWCQMRDRCTNPKYWAFNRYGGRGITVCDRWLGPSGFLNFLSDLGERPSPKHSIDRFPDNDGNYEPGNVRWATQVEQNNNKVNNRLVSFSGRTQTVAEWERELQLPIGSLQSRLQRGWSIEAALTRPYRKTRYKAKHFRSPL